MTNVMKLMVLSLFSVHAVAMGSLPGEIRIDGIFKSKIVAALGGQVFLNEQDKLLTTNFANAYVLAASVHKDYTNELNTDLAAFANAELKNALLNRHLKRCPFFLCYNAGWPRLNSSDPLMGDFCGRVADAMCKVAETVWNPNTQQQSAPLEVVSTNHKSTLTDLTICALVLAKYPEITLNMTHIGTAQEDHREKTVPDWIKRCYPDSKIRFAKVHTSEEYFKRVSIPAHVVYGRDGESVHASSVTTEFKALCEFMQKRNKNLRGILVGLDRTGVKWTMVAPDVTDSDFPEARQTSAGGTAMTLLEPLRRQLTGDILRQSNNEVMGSALTSPGGSPPQVTTRLRVTSEPPALMRQRFTGVPSHSQSSSQLATN